MSFNHPLSVSVQCCWHCEFHSCRLLLAKMLHLSTCILTTKYSTPNTPPYTHTHAHTHAPRTHIAHLSILIVQSQQLMRSFAADHLKATCGYNKEMAKKLAHSCVSQRDIQVCSLRLGVPPSSLVHCVWCAAVCLGSFLILCSLSLLLSLCAVLLLPSLCACASISDLCLFFLISCLYGTSKRSSCSTVFFSVPSL